MNRPLIAFSVFQDEPITALNIINWGEDTPEGLIRYHAKSGVVVKKKEDIEREHTSVKVVRFEELDLHRSLYHWFKKNPYHWRKPLQVDPDLVVGERYQEDGWRMAFLVQPGPEFVKVKPLFD